MDSASKNMSLNGWPEMFKDIYFFSQNAERDQYQIFAHLLEVVAGFQHAVYERNYPLATTSVAKIFSWFCALLKAVGEEEDLAMTVFEKYPRLCPRCQRDECKCGDGALPEIDTGWLRKQVASRRGSMPGPLHEWQKMFDRIYDESGRAARVAPGSPEARVRLEVAAMKLIWELAEVAEAMRQPLYPENLRAELADVFAWQCALVNALPGAFGEEEGPLSFSEVIWQQYPNECDTCLNATCICQPKPIRELISKTNIVLPSVRDELTKLFHRGKFDFDFARAAYRDERAAVLVLDCDEFKKVNEAGHTFGDEVLKYVAKAIQSVVENRGRAYRYGGDEFVVLLFGLTPGEVDEIAVGIRDAVREGEAPRPEPGKEVAVGVTIGIAAQNGGADQALFDAADNALMAVKAAGRRGSVVYKDREVAPPPGS